MSKQSFTIHSLELGPMENFIYLIEDHASGRAAVVDPAWDVPQILQLAKNKGLRITDILLTHSHHDHINGVQEVLATADAQLHLLQAEARFWGQHQTLPTLHHGGDSLLLGKTEIEVLHTPGHTPGSACYHLPGNVITGDTLFVFGCGRCDLHGGDPEQLFVTLRQLKRELPAATIVHPGHNYANVATTTMQEQKEGNPFLHCQDRSSFVHYRMDYHDRHRESPYCAVRPEQMP